MTRRVSLLMMTVLAGIMPCSTRAFAIEKGTITGRVVDAAGNPVAGLVVKLMQDEPQVDGAKGKSKVIAQTKTDADGRFTFDNVDPGNYQVVAGNSKIGWIYNDVRVEPGQKSDLGDLKLIKP